MIQDNYEPVSSSEKLRLLLQRSFRYSYREKFLRLFPNILCEIFLPMSLIMLLAMSKFGVNQLWEFFQNMNSTGIGNHEKACSQDLNLPPISSNELFKQCFQYELDEDPLFLDANGKPSKSSLTNIIFQPHTQDIDQLAKNALAQLLLMGCTNVNVWSENPNNDLIHDPAITTVVVDFSTISNIKNNRNLAYNIISRTSMTSPKPDPIDMSFLAYGHPSSIQERTTFKNTDDPNHTKLPIFTDIKIFVDSLLIEYQTNHKINYDLKRYRMTCAPFHSDPIYSSLFVNMISLMINGIFIIPYLLLLTSLIREKKSKVKEILKVLGIKPILNNFAHAIRTMIILLILIVLLTIMYKINLSSDAYFDTVNGGVLFLGNLVYSFQLVSFCIMNAQLFDSTIRAIVITFGFYVISNTIFSLMILWSEIIQYLLIFISPFIAEHSLFQQLVLHDLANKDVAFFQPIYRHVPIYFLTLIIMICSSIFYWILSWYLEKVFPGEYGIPQEWNFLFKREYWRRSTMKNQVYSYDNLASEFSGSSTQLTRTNSIGIPVVHVDHLVKKFGPDKIAVNDVSFDLYENQITSLLGPNGSGKTTIFNCLIGIYKQTSGTITMANSNGTDYDTRNNIDMLRKSIGYCPQHDILFDLLTIEEQIQFYASARGFGKYKQQISDEMLHLVNLQTSKDMFCNELSGGMKRRLSLACAFVGDTKIILLDEPSSGLDPSNRRLLWDWLRTMKEGKTLLLTTHFMEESDALSDRIMIITNGIIKADGTSAKLKQQYGSGYKLVVNKQSDYDTNAISHELRGFLPQIVIEADIPGGDVVFRTNQQPDNRFVEALRQLDIMKSKNLIKSYGVQNSTMDDVFLKITRETQHDNKSDTSVVKIEKIDDQCREVFEDREFSHGILYYLTQLYGLLIKTLLVRYRRWGLACLILLFPIIYHTSKNITGNKDSFGTFKMHVNALNPQTILYNSDSAMKSYFQAAVKIKSKGLKLEERSETISEMNKFIWQKRMHRPYTYTDIYLAFQLSAPQGDVYKIQSLSSNLISSYEVVSVTSDTIYKHVLKDLSASIQSTVIFENSGNFTLTNPSIQSATNAINMVSCFFKLLPLPLLPDIIICYFIFFYIAIFLINERKDSFFSLLNISGLHPILYWIFQYLFDIILSTIWFCYVLAIYCLVDTAFNGLPSKRSKSTAELLVNFGSGWDLKMNFYPLTIIILLPTLPVVYLLTKIFKTDMVGGLIIWLVLIIFHIISIVLPIITILLNKTFVRDIVYWSLNILIPNINAEKIITYILVQKFPFCKQLFNSFSLSMGNSFEAVSNDTIPWNWVILVGHIFIFFSILIINDTGLLKFSCCNCYKPNCDEKILDNDVLAERQRILNLMENQKSTNTSDEDEKQETDHCVVHDLVKCFPGRNVCAVNHLTFGAKRGEAFGLLGYNGAGKTTTFRILVGDETASQGTAYIDGQNVTRRLRSLRHLGYCPQQDCRMEFLTVQDALYLLARIRAVPFSRTHAMVQTISSLFLLDPFLHNYIHQLSGGTKRRLHAALALIGPPLVAILDEPTTGVDPNARQQMQEIFLNTVKAKLTIILTSHSMDECERVCNRLGIMIDGQLACLGTIQHLKSKFGRGYTLEIKAHTGNYDTGDQTIAKIQSFLISQTQFNIHVKEITQSTGIFQIEKGLPADLFELIEQNKERLNIETYTITQTTLEQIFLSLGK